MTNTPKLYDGNTRRFDAGLLREALIAQGFSNAVLCERTGLKISTVQKIRGGKSVSDETANLVLHVLGLAEPIRVAI